MINWNVSKADHDLIVQIAERVAKITDNYPDTKAALIMDLTATHANGTPLDLPKLLAAEPFDFTHDIFGIRRHINRKTGKLEGCFMPRCAQANHDAGVR